MAFPFGFMFGNGHTQAPARNLTPEEREVEEANTKSRVFLFAGFAVLAYIVCF
eukprot:NODE_8660_length_400_cov_20.458689_g7777_i0.p4 GENE.NODE_8660_length_400_cov_20.458689_g7777_i0~~NODE_8660_length_400_cov_20.458689_g7777_i0.p4  ORF type:complete len:53 (+),score=12.71 NODE_8660_length_400_cov_20.458689_g7777_i0:154-312(+)